MVRPGSSVLNSATFYFAIVSLVRGKEAHMDAALHKTTPRRPIIKSMYMFRHPYPREIILVYISRSLGSPLLSSHFGLS